MVAFNRDIFRFAGFGLISRFLQILAQILADIGNRQQGFMIDIIDQLPVDVLQTAVDNQPRLFRCPGYFFLFTAVNLFTLKRK